MRAQAVPSSLGIREELAASTSLATAWQESIAWSCLPDIDCAGGCPGQVLANSFDGMRGREEGGDPTECELRDGNKGDRNIPNSPPSTHSS